MTNMLTTQDLFVMACSAGSDKIVKLILETKNTEIKINGGEQKRTSLPPFIAAVGKGHLGIVKLLREHGADIKITCSEGKDALIHEIRSNALLIFLF